MLLRYSYLFSFLIVQSISPGSLARSPSQSARSPSGISSWSQPLAQENPEIEQAEEEEPPWDVNTPPGETFEVAIETDEGTWMSLDVSPDGSEVAFDLLGDLYAVSIAGGEARVLTEGMAWDMQPRYSPDGQSIAFTSDRGGGDNLWVMGRDGSDPRQVTKEDFRLVNSPAWSPDGQFIAGRKHFTSRRSLGAGEIWLYHVSGGTGLQMTEKPNLQKDLGRAGVLTGRTLPLLQPRRHARKIVRVQQGSTRPDLRDQPTQPPHRTHRALRHGSGRFDSSHAVA